MHKKISDEKKFSKVIFLLKKLPFVLYLNEKINKNSIKILVYRNETTGKPIKRSILKKHFNWNNKLKQEHFFIKVYSN